MFQKIYFPQAKFFGYRFSKPEHENEHLKENLIKTHHGIFSDDSRAFLTYLQWREIIEWGIGCYLYRSPQVIDVYPNKIHRSKNIILDYGRIIGYEGGQYGIAKNHPWASLLEIDIELDENRKIIKTAFPLCLEKAQSRRILARSNYNNAEILRA